MSCKCISLLSVLFSSVFIFAQDPGGAKQLRRVIPTRIVDGDLLALQGIIISKTAPSQAIVYNKAIGQSAWYKAGDALGDFTVKAITSDGVTLIDRQSSRETILRLVQESIGREGVASEEAPLYSKAWINSKANPMLHNRVMLPEDIIRNWTELTGDERSAVVKFYENHGWRLVSVEVDGGSKSFIWDNIYEKERRSAILENKRNFEASLEPEKMKVWKAFSTNKIIKSVGGQFSPEQKVEIAARQKAFAEFTGSLSVEQRARFEGIQDFTNADWK